MNLTKSQKRNSEIDPLRFLQKITYDHNGLRLNQPREIKNMSCFSSLPNTEKPSFYRANFDDTTRRESNPEGYAHLLDIELIYTGKRLPEIKKGHFIGKNSKSYEKNYCDFDFDTKFLGFMKCEYAKRFRIDGQRLPDFLLGSEGLDFFGEYSDSVGLEFDYRRICWGGADKNKDGDLTFRIKRSKKNLTGYRIETTWGWNIERSAIGSVFLQDEFSDVIDLNSKWHNGDFRPYLHRLIELYNDVPVEKRHDPSIYSSESQARREMNANGLEQVISRTIESLFTGDERTNMKKRFEEAKLVVNGQWSSIPKMNLGLVILPKIGGRENEVETILGGAALLANILSYTGVMPKEEAERMMAQRLTNRITGSEFQLTRENAARVLEQLK